MRLQITESMARNMAELESGYSVSAGGVDEEAFFVAVAGRLVTAEAVEGVVLRQGLVGLARKLGLAEAGEADQLLEIGEQGRGGDRCECVGCDCGRWIIRLCLLFSCFSFCFVCFVFVLFAFFVHL